MWIHVNLSLHGRISHIQVCLTGPDSVGSLQNRCLEQIFFGTTNLDMTNLLNNGVGSLQNRCLEGSSYRGLLFQHFSVLSGHTLFIDVWEDIYRITSKYSKALRTSQTCSFAKWYYIFHPKVAFEAPLWCARYGTKSYHDGILHSSLNQCWKTLLFEYLAAIRYIFCWFWKHTTKQCLLRKDSNMCSILCNAIATRNEMSLTMNTQNKRTKQPTKLSNCTHEL